MGPAANSPNPWIHCHGGYRATRRRRGPALHRPHWAATDRPSASRFDPLARLFTSPSTDAAAPPLPFEASDAPTDSQIDEYINDLERVAFPGLERDQYNWLVVEHRDEDGGVHLHYLVPMIELRSGRQYNPAPPGWAAMGYDDLRDTWNAREGWARPDDGSHARLVQPGRYAYVTAEQLRAGLEVEPDANPREAIGAWT